MNGEIFEIFEFYPNSAKKRFVQDNLIKLYYTTDDLSLEQINENETIIYFLGICKRIFKNKNWISYSK